jgi:hypothetical protein
MILSQSSAVRSAGVSQQRVSQANSVLSHAPDLADGVVAGLVPLGKAYETARDRKEAAKSTDTHMVTLRKEAPDLYAKALRSRPPRLPNWNGLPQTGGFTAQGAARPVVAVSRCEPVWKYAACPPPG